MLESKLINGEWCSKGNSFRTDAEKPIASQPEQMQPELTIEPCDWEKQIKHSQKQQTGVILQNNALKNQNGVYELDDTGPDD